MKLNEIAAGKRIWVLVEMWDDHGSLGDVDLSGAYTSKKAAEIAWMQAWLDAAEDDIANSVFNDEEGPDGDSVKDPLPQLSKYAAAGNMSKFDKLASAQEGVLPSWDDFADFVTIVETKLF